jgi:hypothetical protein
MWTLPEASEIARPNAKVEEGNIPVAAECGSKKVGCFSPANFFYKQSRVLDP